MIPETIQWGGYGDIKPICVFDEIVSEPKGDIFGFMKQLHLSFKQMKDNEPSKFHRRVFYAVERKRIDEYLGWSTFEFEQKLNKPFYPETLGVSHVRVADDNWKMISDSPQNPNCYTWHTVFNKYFLDIINRVAGLSPKPYIHIVVQKQTNPLQAWYLLHGEYITQDNEQLEIFS